MKAKIDLSNFTGYTTAALLLMAAAGKMSVLDKVDRWMLLAIMEPFLALLAIGFHRAVVVRVFLSMIFFGFALYLLVYLPPTSFCKCFGAINIFRPWQVFGMDLFLGGTWLLLSVSPLQTFTTFKTQATCIAMGAGLIACLVIGFVAFTVKAASSTVNEQATFVEFISISDQELLNASDAVYLLNTHCSHCVAALERFVAICEERRLQGVILIGHDARSVELPASIARVRLAIPEASFKGYPSAILVRNGKSKGQAMHNRMNYAFVER